MKPPRIAPQTAWGQGSQMAYRLICLFPGIDISGGEPPKTVQCRSALPETRPCVLNARKWMMHPLSHALVSSASNRPPVSKIVWPRRQNDAVVKLIQSLQRSCSSSSSSRSSSHRNGSSPIGGVLTGVMHERPVTQSHTNSRYLIGGGRPGRMTLGCQNRRHFAVHCPGRGGHYRSYPGGQHDDCGYRHPNERNGNAPHPGAMSTCGYPAQYYGPDMCDCYHCDAAYYGGYMRSGDKRRRGRKRASTQSKESSVDDDVRYLSGDVGVDEKSGRGSTLNSPVGVWANEVPAAKVVNDKVTFADNNGSRI